MNLRQSCRKMSENIRSSNCRKWCFRGSIFQKFPGKYTPIPSRNLVTNSHGSALFRNPPNMNLLSMALHAFRTSGKHQAWNDNQFTKPFLTEIFIWKCWKSCFLGVQAAKISWHPLVFSGFAFGWPLCGQKSRRGTVQRLDTLIM